MAAVSAAAMMRMRSRPGTRRESMTSAAPSPMHTMTGGAGDFSYEFARYEQAPSDVQGKEVAARAALAAEGSEED